MAFTRFYELLIMFITGTIICGTGIVLESGPWYIVIEKSRARSPFFPSSVNDLEIPALLPQAINATVNTIAKGTRNRSLLRWHWDFGLGYWLFIEVPLNLSSDVIHRETQKRVLF